MDTKALARSKRAHSLRHAKKNIHAGSKKPSVNSGSVSENKKPVEDQVGENTSKHHGSKALLSNWDHFIEESNSEDPAGGKSSQSPDFVVPKSKGADYAFLISEAKAQIQPNVFPSFDNIFDDFTQGFGPMLSAKGQGLLSWTAEDDFYIDDKDSKSNEAAFLSLNFHAFAKQLEKSKYSERLFVDPDVLPPELLNEELQACAGVVHDHVQFCSSAVEIDTEASSMNQDIEENASAQYYHEPLSPATTITRNTSGKAARDKSHYANQTMDDFWKSQETDQKSTSKSTVDSASKKPATFKAANAEAELDLLLDSFNETSFFEPSRVGKKSGNEFELFQEMPSVGISSVPLASAEIEKNNGAETSETPWIPADIGDSFDNFLEQTSNLVKNQGGSLSHELKPSQYATESNSKGTMNSKSKLLDDFDSWLDTI